MNDTVVSVPGMPYNILANENYALITLRYVGPTHEAAINYSAMAHTEN